MTTLKHTSEFGQCKDPVIKAIFIVTAALRGPGAHVPPPDPPAPGSTALGVPEPLLSEATCLPAPHVPVLVKNRAGFRFLREGRCELSWRKGSPASGRRHVRLRGPTGVASVPGEGAELAPPPAR